jgi:hypothetical protein
LPGPRRTGSVADVGEPGRLLATYDEQLRGDAEITPGAMSMTRLGPLYLVTFDRFRSWVTYRDLRGEDAAGMRQLDAGALDHYRADASIRRVEWKSRGHDAAPGLHDALLEHGLVAEEPESTMIGEARALAVDVPLPDGVTLRRITADADVRAMSAMADRVFGDQVSEGTADGLIRRLAQDEGMEIWVAEAGGGSSAWAGWNGCTGRRSPACGAARRSRRRGAAGSTAR